MGRTCGGPSEIELTPTGVELNGSRRVPDGLHRVFLEPGVCRMRNTMARVSASVAGVSLLAPANVPYHKQGGGPSGRFLFGRWPQDYFHAFKLGGPASRLHVKMKMKFPRFQFGAERGWVLAVPTNCYAWHQRTIKKRLVAGACNFGCGRRIICSCLGALCTAAR